MELRRATEREMSVANDRGKDLVSKLLHTNDMFMSPSQAVREENVRETASVFAELLRCEQHRTAASVSYLPLIVLVLRQLWDSTTDCFKSIKNLDRLQLKRGLLDISLQCLSKVDIVPAKATSCDAIDHFTFGHALLNICFETPHWRELLERTVQRILVCDCSGERTMFIKRVWYKKDKLSLSLKLAEDIVQNEPLVVEAPLLTLALQVGKFPSSEATHMIEDALKEMHTKSLISLCSRSPVMFQTVTSILHSINTVAPNLSLITLAQMFVNAVSAMCGRSDFVSLFPQKYQTLVTYLQIPPELFPEDAQVGGTGDTYVIRTRNVILDKRSVINLLIEGLLHNRDAITVLLIYYPDWFTELCHFCNSRNVPLFPLFS